MPFFDTIEYVDAGGATQEVALKLANIANDAGLVTAVFNPRSHAPSTFTLTWTLAPELALVIPFRSRCKIYANRSSAGGGAGSFSGGAIIFQGRRTDRRGSASANRVLSSIVLSDAWWDLMHITYTLPWRYINGGTLAAPTYATFNWPDIVLFQATPGVTYSPAPVALTINTFQQAKAIIDFAAAFGTGDDAVQIQMSTAEFAPVYVNWYPVRSSKAAECLSFCLRPHPGVFSEMDYSTTPPTLHLRNRAAMTTVTLPYKATDAGGIIHVASEIERLDDLKPDAVRLFYKINGTYNGQPIVTYSNDNYPTSANKLLSLDFSIDVTGSTRAETRYTFVSATFTPTDKNFWRQKVSSLRQLSEGGQIPNDGSAGAATFVDANPYDAGLHPKGVQILGDDGTDYSSSYGTAIPYVTEMDLFSWMKLNSGATPTVVKATVKAFFTYDKISPQGSGSVTDTFAEHHHSFRVLLTNAPSATYVLAQTTNSGESIPAGLAQAIYSELQAPQWRVHHEIFQVAADDHSLPTLIKPGLHKVNLAGGDAAWTTMNAVPENVSIHLFRTGDDRLAAQSSISCGPVGHLEPSYLLQLHNLFWNRDRSGIDAYQRLTGGTASSTVDLSSTAPKENSVPGEPVPQSTNHVYVAAGVVAGQVQNDAKGVATITAGKTPLGSGSAAEMVKMKPREVSLCDNTGTVFKAAVQSTEGHT